jgi:hypothetical protein
MIRFLIRTAVFFASALIGLFVADMILTDLSVTGESYLLVAIIFALIQALISPLMFKTVHRNASAFTGGVGLISTLVALIATTILTSGLTITGLTTWILAALIVWLAGAIAAFLLPLIFLKRTVQERHA